MAINKIYLIENELSKPTEFLDYRNCIILDAYNGYILDENKKVNFCDLFEKSRLADPSYSGCYVLPNEMMTIREVYERLLINEIKRMLLKRIIESKELDNETNLLVSKYEIHSK